jgi:hypothetical protein
MTELLTFAATFLLVLALALQSLNTNGGHHVAAVFTSVLIGFMQLYVLKTIPVSESWSVDAAYLAGGPLGAVVAMWIHPRTIGKRKGMPAVFRWRRGGPGNINCGADRP